MPYVAPSTKSALTTLTSTEWNTVVNDIIDLNLRANIAPGTYASRPASPTLGSLYYQTDTDELVKYVTDLDGQNRWMQVDHDYRRNFVINGGFNFWQRGTSFDPTSASTFSGANYGADRWQFIQATASAGAFTRQAVPFADPPGFNYGARVRRASTLTLTTPYTIQTSFETNNIRNVCGKYLTLSFWARAGANYSATGSVLVSNIVTGEGVDNTVGNFTTSTVNTTTNNVLTTSWKRFSITTSAALASTIKQLGVSFVFTPTGTAGASDYYDITGVQLEVGTAPSDFEYQDAGEELRRCQRYYFQYNTVAASFQRFGYGQAVSATTANAFIQFPQVMRQTPSIVTSASAANYGALNASGSAVSCNGLPTIGVGTDFGATVNFPVAAGLVAGNSTAGVNNNVANNYLGFSAEL